MKRFKARQTYLLFILFLSVFLITGCGGGGETGHWDPTHLVSIEVTPPNQSIAKGTTQQFMATGIYSNNTTKDLTSSVTWTSSITAVATISNAPGFTGLATSKVKGGPVTITASDPATGIAGTATLSVTNATLVSIGVTPVNPSIARGTKQQFMATGTFTDLTTQNLTSSVTWSSSDETVATISNAPGFNGVATSLAVGGPITITATDPVSTISGNTQLTVTAATLVSITVTPVNPSIARGTKQQFVATGTFTFGPTQDLTTFVTWSPANAAVAIISNASGTNGQATALLAGATVITATYTDPITLATTSGSTTLTVTPATLVSIGVTPVNPIIARGTTQQFKATGIYTAGPPQDLTSYVTWSPSNGAIANISNAAGSNGLANALTVGGPITITATDPASAISGTAQLTVTAATLVSIGVTPVNPSVARGTKQQFTATGTFTFGPPQDLTTAVTWSPSNAAVAIISNAAGTKGQASALTVGVTTITATYTDLITLAPTSGSTTLTVTAATLVSIGVTPVTPSIALGLKQQFIATGTYTFGPPQDLTSYVTWSPSNAAVAGISNAAGTNGQATSLATGITTITATDPDPASTISGTAQLTVTPATLVSIAVTPVNPSIARGTKQQFTATGTFTFGPPQDLTTAVSWNPSDATVAGISNAAGTNGQATALTVGITTITATYTDPITLALTSGSTTLTVTAATLVSIAVTPVNPSIVLGTNQQFKATGTYTAGPTQDLTSSVTWSPSNAAVAGISNAAGSNGLATSLTAGSTTITAADPDPASTIKGTTTLTVTGVTLVSIAVTPANPGISVGATQQFTATGTYSSGPTQVLTTLVTWKTTPTISTVADISNAAGSNGLATGLTVGGPIPITATYTDPVTLVLTSGTTNLTVTMAPNLKSAQNFAVIASAAISGGAVGTAITAATGTADIGIATKTLTSITDFVGGGPPATPGTVSGTIYASDAPSAGNTVSSTARADVGLAYAAAKTTATLGFTTVSGNLVGMGNGVNTSTFTPGIYHSTSTLSIAGSAITLDPLGDANAVWIFDMESTLTTTTGGDVILVAPAQAKNVFWRVGSSATLGAAIFKGTILASDTISVTTQAVAVDGRLLASAVNDGAVTFSSHAHTVVVPAP